MKIVGIYSFNKGKEIIEQKHPDLVAEIKKIISSVDAPRYKSKKSKEKTMKGRMLFSPVRLNKSFKSEFKNGNGSRLKWRVIIRQVVMWMAIRTKKPRVLSVRWIL